MSRLNLPTFLTAVFLTVLAGSGAMAQFTISGTVTGPGALPVLNVDVFLYDDQGNAIGIPPTQTDFNGFYSISNIPDATYGLEFQPTKASLLLMKFVSPVVVTGNVTLNVSLVRGNYISGSVRDTAGVGIFGIDVNVYIHPADTLIYTALDDSDPAGFYGVVVPDGTFRIRWRPVGGENLVPVELENVTITADTSINVTMVSGVYVSGTVRDNSSQPVFNADLDFIDASTGQKIVTPSDNTDNNGDYLVLIPRDTFNIQLEPLFTDGLVPKEVLNVPIKNDTTINFTVFPGHVISGTVTGPARAPVANVDIDLIITSTGTKLFTPQDNTNSLGQYQLLAVTGIYDIVAKPPVATGLAPVVTDSVNVNSATVVNFSVPSGFLVSGTVRNNNLVAVAGVDIDAALSSSGAPVFLSGDNTNGSGNFGVVIVGGTYNFDIEPPVTRRLTAQRLKNLLVSGDLILNITLDTGIVISGTVTDSAAVPVANVNVSAIVSSSGDTVFTPLDNTGAQGTYQVHVPPDDYKIVYIASPPALLNDTVILNSVTIVHDTTINIAFSSGLPACCVGLRGDANSDGVDANILDLTFLVNRIFRGGPPPVCPQEANVNSDGATANILDLTFLVNRIFRGGPQPGAC